MARGYRTNVSGGGTQPNILTIFDSVNGLNSEYALSGSYSIDGTSPNRRIVINRGGRATLVQTLDVKKYSKIIFEAYGGYSGYPFDILNGNSLLIRMQRETAPYDYYEKDISSLDYVDLVFRGSDATSANYISKIELQK